MENKRDAMEAVKWLWRKDAGQLLGEMLSDREEAFDQAYYMDEDASDLTDPGSKQWVRSEADKIWKDAQAAYEREWEMYTQYMEFAVSSLSRLGLV